METEDEHVPLQSDPDQDGDADDESTILPTPVGFKTLRSACRIECTALTFRHRKTRLYWEQFRWLLVTHRRRKNSSRRKTSNHKNNKKWP